MENSDKKNYALNILRQKYADLGRLPKRSDFDGDTVCFIKQKLGPWPRALEAAGLKEPPRMSAKERSRVKRERSRKRRKLYKKYLSENSDSTAYEESLTDTNTEG